MKARGGSAPTVSPLEATGVGLLTVAGYFAVYALVYLWGDGDPMSLTGTCLSLAMGVCVVLTWRLGPRRMEPLLVGLALLVVAFLMMGLTVIAGMVALLTGLIAARRTAAVGASSSVSAP